MTLTVECGGGSCQVFQAVDAKMHGPLVFE